MKEKKIVSKTRCVRSVPQSLEEPLRRIVAKAGGEP
jgi:hypothetical protein